ncbi:MAG: glycoside hydrolase family 16 protein [Actinomycetota bacterium]|nr:glycoside hydrolase family 16 protein [Actinomycetota bacterium]
MFQHVEPMVPFGQEIVGAMLADHLYLPVRLVRVIKVGACSVVSLALGAALALIASTPALAADPTVTQVTLSPGYVAAGSSVRGTLQVTASSSLTARAVGIAVRDSAGAQFDYPAAASNLSLGPSTYTFTSGYRAFTAGTYSVFGFWQDLAGIYHALPATTLTVGAAVSSPTPTEVTLSPGYVAAGSPVSGTLQVTAPSPVTPRVVGIAVRDSLGGEFDYPASTGPVGFDPSTYTFTSGPRTFTAGTYSVFGFWRDSSNVYHDLESTPLTVGMALPPPSDPLPIGIPGPWTLQRTDEFNAMSLDTTMWQAGWFGSGVTSPVDPKEEACYDTDNVTFPGDGRAHLTLTSTQSSCGGWVHPYTGALVSSNRRDGRLSGGFDYTHGAIEAAVYVPPAGAQIANWPAVWTDGQPKWPSNGENDIMEGLSGAACYTFHSPTSNSGGCPNGHYAGWHTFASDWEPGSVTFYYDGVQVGQITSGPNSAVTGSPMFMVIANTVAAGIGGPTVSPADMEVDYIRVWQHR